MFEESSHTLEMKIVFSDITIADCVTLRNAMMVAVRCCGYDVIEDGWGFRARKGPESSLGHSLPATP